MTMTNLTVQRDDNTLKSKVSCESTSFSMPPDYANNHDSDSDSEWTKNRDAKFVDVHHSPNPMDTSRSFCINTLTAMYALILTMVACVIEISPTWRSDEMWLAYSIFCVLMYAVAVANFIYLYLFVLYPNLINNCIYHLFRRGYRTDPAKYLLDEPVYNGEGAGTMYLRVGALFFGSMGSVLWGTEILLCFFEHQRHGIYVVKYILALVFTYMQMHFIFSNSKISLKRSNVLAKFGLMHSIAVNLWTWLSICLIKSSIKHVKKEIKYAKEEMKNFTMPIWSYDFTAEFEPHDKQLRAIIKIGSNSNLLLTCLVEFSLIAAAICFIIWKNDDPNPGEIPHKAPKKKEVRFDCTGTSTGIFLAIMVHIASVVVISMHGILNKSEKEKSADLLVGWAEIFLFTVALLACFLAFFRMRKLHYRLHAHGEVIDEILLIVGLAGECVYSCAGMDLYFNDKLLDSSPPPITIVAFTLRITEVLVQTVFILFASRMRCYTVANRARQPGKQVITFLLVCNINLFIYHSFESMESNFGFPIKLPDNYSVMLNIASPIVVFYRFHSSACLAEIWKHTYSRKNGSHEGSMVTIDKM